MSRTHSIQTHPFWRGKFVFKGEILIKIFDTNGILHANLPSTDFSLFLRYFNQALISIDFYPVSGRNHFRRVLIKLGHGRYARNHCAKDRLGIASPW